MDEKLLSTLQKTLKIDTFKKYKKTRSEYLNSYPIWCYSNDEINEKKLLNHWEYHLFTLFLSSAAAYLISLFTVWLVFVIHGDSIAKSIHGCKLLFQYTSIPQITALIITFSSTTILLNVCIPSKLKKINTEIIGNFLYAHSTKLLFTYISLYTLTNLSTTNIMVLINYGEYGLFNANTGLISIALILTTVIAYYFLTISAIKKTLMCYTSNISLKYLYFKLLTVAISLLTFTSLVIFIILQSTQENKLLDIYIREENPYLILSALLIIGLALFIKNENKLQIVRLSFLFSFFIPTLELPAISASSWIDATFYDEDIPTISKSASVIERILFSPTNLDWEILAYIIAGVVICIATIGIFNQYIDLIKKTYSNKSKILNLSCKLLASVALPALLVMCIRTQFLSEKNVLIYIEDNVDAQITVDGSEYNGDMPIGTGLHFFEATPKNRHSLFRKVGFFYIDNNPIFTTKDIHISFDSK